MPAGHVPRGHAFVASFSPNGERSLMIRTFNDGIGTTPSFFAPSLQNTMAVDKNIVLYQFESVDVVMNVRPITPTP